MISPELSRTLSRIIPFGVIWLFFSIVYTLLEKGILGDLTVYPATGNPYNFQKNMLITPAFALVTGLLIGTTETLYFSKWFNRNSFSEKIFYKSVIYLFIILLFLITLTGLANVFELQTSLHDAQVWIRVWAFVFDYAFASVAAFMAAIILVSLFYAEVSENIGNEALRNFFTGTYHKPKEEERIFMFLDMKSSTRLAELLGHVKYFTMLKEYYADLSGSIIKHSGSVYQYVGDEIVVSWSIDKGISRGNCIQCFFAMKAALRRQADKYERRFGVVPAFKAGFHVGKVTTGEIGVLKKNIVFTGDVLNTTARIQGLCNINNVDILVSGDLINKIDLADEFRVIRIGENTLRGRDEKVDLYTIAIS